MGRGLAALPPQAQHHGDIDLGSFAYNSAPSSPRDTRRAPTTPKVTPLSLTLAEFVDRTEALTGQYVDLGDQWGSLPDPSDGAVALEGPIGGEDGEDFEIIVLAGHRLPHTASGTAASSRRRYRVVEISRGCTYAGQGITSCAIESTR